MVFGIEELPEDLWPFAMYLIAGCVWQQVRRRPNRQRLLVVDEAWLLLQHQDGGRFLENVVRLARSYGMGLVFITQDVKNVLSDPRGSVIADNVFSTLLLRQSGKSQQSTTQTQQLVAEQFGLSTEEQRRLSSALPGHGLLLVGPWRVHLHVIATKAEERVAMTARNAGDDQTTTGHRTSETGVSVAGCCGACRGSAPSVRLEPVPGVVSLPRRP